MPDMHHTAGGMQQGRAAGPFAKRVGRKIEDFVVQRTSCVKREAM
ncbi:hypothetical protein [Nitrosomonas sp. Nm51]|nr:hypothetical protein [Nitrosomonas sp. Nm51]